jgi:hypothetical protein
MVAVNTGDSRYVGVRAGANKWHGLGKDIIEGYSECHWPGGQLRVSTPNFMVETHFNLPKG